MLSDLMALSTSRRDTVRRAWKEVSGKRHQAPTGISNGGLRRKELKNNVLCWIGWIGDKIHVVSCVYFTVWKDFPFSFKDDDWLDLKFLQCGGNYLVFVPHDGIFTGLRIMFVEDTCVTNAENKQNAYSTPIRCEKNMFFQFFWTFESELSAQGRNELQSLWLHLGRQSSRSSSGAVFGARRRDLGQREGKAPGVWNQRRRTYSFCLRKGMTKSPAFGIFRKVYFMWFCLGVRKFRMILGLVLGHTKKCFRFFPFGFCLRQILGEGDDHCLWPGISCYESCRIFKIHKDGSTLAGDLSSLEALEELEFLLLPGTAVRGDLSALQHLTLLWSLDLTGTKVAGDLQHLRRLRRLRWLKMSESQVSGNVFFLQNLTWLRELRLSKTQITGDVASLKKLQELKILDLSETSVIGNMGLLAKLPLLEKADLSATAVSGWFNEQWMGCCPKLMMLNLAVGSSAADYLHLLDILWQNMSFSTSKESQVSLKSVDPRYPSPLVDQDKELLPALNSLNADSSVGKAFRS